MSPSRGRRRYRLVARAERQAATRRRITEAAIRLHEDAGPLRTSIAEVARQAGVTRPTVYRHFPDELSLLRACQQHWLHDNPPPDPSLWAGILDPVGRVRRALADLYAFYRRGVRMTDNLFRDAPRSREVSEVLAPIVAGLDASADLLAQGFRVAPQKRRGLRAALGLALSFQAWHSLALASGLSDEEAADLMSSLVRGWVGDVAAHRGPQR